MTLLLRYISNRGNVIMHEFYMNLSFKIFDRSENLFKLHIWCHHILTFRYDLEN